MGQRVPLGEDGVLTGQGAPQEQNWGEMELQGPGVSSG